MKKTLLTLFTVLLAAVSTNAQEWQWGTATWNIEDGKVFEGIDDLNAGGIVLTYPNPADYPLTAMNAIGVAYEIYVDGDTEPIEDSSTTPFPLVANDLSITLSYKFAEGHSYRVVTTGASLVAPNFVTYVTDTISHTTDSYTISFSIKGPEIVKTIDVEATMALTITDQYNPTTYSVIDKASICNALGIDNLDQASIYGLQPNGAYIEREYCDNLFDGWRDADGDYTLWAGDSQMARDVLGHKPYPSVFALQLNATADTISYFFYDYWKVYDPDEPTEVPGSNTAKSRVPETSYNSVIWDWEYDDEEGHHVDKYTRRYRCDEGKDYKGSFIYKANNKAVYVNATLHFVSQEDYASYLTDIYAPEVEQPEETDAPEVIYSIDGTPLPALQQGLNIVRKGAVVKKVLVK